MRNLYDFRSVTKLLALLIVVGAGLQSCRDFDDLRQDVVLYVDTDVVLNPLTLQIVDEEIGVPLPEDLSITVLGEDRDKVYSVLGEKSLSLDTNLDDPAVGILQLGVRKIEEPTPEEPVDFTLKFEAEGYETLYRSFSLVEGENRLMTLKMRQHDREMDGVATRASQFDVSSQGAAEEVSFASSPTQRAELVEVQVPSGTLVYDQEGVMLTGEVNVMMKHYDLYNGNAANAVPGGQLARHVRDLDGEYIGNVPVKSIAAYSLDMFVDDKEVKTFSEPIDVTFHISENIINPQTYQPYQEGDEVSVLSFDEEEAEWQVEMTAQVTRDAYGDLVVNYRQPHLSTWLLTSSFSFCRFARLDIVSGISESDPQRFYFAEFVRIVDNEVTDEVIGEPEFFRFYNGEQIYVLRGVDEDAVLRIYNGFSEDCKQELLFESAPLNTCSGTYVIDVSDVIDNANALTVEVAVRGTCSSEFNDLIVVPTLPILFRQTGCTTWSKLGILRSGEGETSSLEKSETYDFRISYRQLDRCVLALQVPTKDSTFNIESPVYDFYETVDINYEENGKALRFEYLDIEVPDLACQEYIDAFGRGSATSRPPQ